MKARNGWEESKVPPLSRSVASKVVGFTPTSETISPASDVAILSMRLTAFSKSGRSFRGATAPPMTSNGRIDACTSIFCTNFCPVGSKIKISSFCPVFVLDKALFR